MRRIALISDIHANAEALAAVLADIDAAAGSGPAAAPIDALWCLGDIVGYGHDPIWCLRQMEARADLILAGNHDLAVAGVISDRAFTPAARAGIAYSRAQLAAEEPHLTRRIAQRPSELTINPRTLYIRRGWVPSGDFIIAHGCPSPFDPVADYVELDASPAELAAASNSAALVAVGHTHHPLAERHGHTLVINAGSVGQPRDEDPRACWTLLEVDEQGVPARVTHHRVDYDVERASARIRAAGLPDDLADRITVGT